MPPFVFVLALDAADHDAVVQRTKFHGAFLLVSCDAGSGNASALGGSLDAA